MLVVIPLSVGTANNAEPSRLKPDVRCRAACSRETGPTANSTCRVLSWKAPLKKPENVVMRTVKAIGEKEVVTFASEYLCQSWLAVGLSATGAAEAARRGDRQRALVAGIRVAVGK